MWLRSFVPRHDSQAAGCSCPSTCSLTTPACPWLQPSHTAQSIKLQYKNKLKKGRACFFSLVLSRSRYISLFVSNKTCGWHISLPPSICFGGFVFVCAETLRTAGRWHQDCRCTHPEIVRTVRRPPEMLPTRLENQGKQEEDVGHLGQLSGHVISKYLSLTGGGGFILRKESFFTKNMD